MTDPTAPEPTWRKGLDDAEVAEVLALLDAASAADHTAPVSENALLQVRAGAEAGPTAGPGTHLLARAGGELVGYANLDTGNPDELVGELAVHPGRRRRGVGTALVTALLDRAAGTPLRLWAHGEHPGALRLAEKLGFSQVRTLWQMRRALSEPPIPEPDFAPGVRLRTFVVGADEAEFLRVNNAAFDWHPEQGGWGIEQVKVREAEPWFDPAGFLLAVDHADRLLGFHWTKVHPAEGDDPPIGEVYVLGVDPSAQGGGLGAALTLAGLRHLRGLGLADVMLYTEADNHAAVRVYEKLGFTRWHTDAAFLR